MGRVNTTRPVSFQRIVVIGSSSFRTSFIEQQRIGLEVEKARCEQAMQQAQVAMKRAYAEAERAVAAMRAPWDAALSGSARQYWPVQPSAPGVAP